MKKSVWMISIMFFLSMTLVGCATKGDLEKVQAQEQQINLKADQALKASQDANEAAIKAAEAAKMAEERAVAAEERAKAAEERAEQADTMFKKSMRK
ncbi:Lpp/OprI family alanine-zipper lipoprotein [Syntrophus aciditrophicus]|jgi:cytochrome c biogenesis protein ResB|uniref:Hypothetical exported protein n=1 Tax=Syntrophus aciditrophicus (strain SB) TaxID=56780 RepID=Q2LTM6_SYNAS|nr:Lpp/OprI family alanine-zipper lipoprotein [Syntrophus aciditrophicus]ABC77437.1 hypothetical exported protein [Syntrophus aciditrophicus SB]OPY19070.1 MAG: hypothetical protein A4E74_00177 [Syntrophus sp. PtaB.Bin075]